MLKTKDIKIFDVVKRTSRRTTVGGYTEKITRHHFSDFKAACEELELVIGDTKRNVEISKLIAKAETQPDSGIRVSEDQYTFHLFSEMLEVTIDLSYDEITVLDLEREPEEREIIFVDKGVFGDEEEHYFNCKCHDGYAIGKAADDEDCGVDKILVIYPTLEAVSKLKLKEEILDWFGLHDKEDITFGDVAIKYGHIII